MSPEALARLRAAAEARKDRDLAQLQSALAEDRRLEAQIAELAQASTRDMEAAGTVPFSQLALRLAWAEQKAAQARKRQADLRAELPRLRREAARSLGRHEALTELARREAAEKARRTAARAERETPPHLPQGLSGKGRART
jgi:septation ring formation regulator EzrA